MLRIPIVDRAAMNAEQARVYDAAKAAGGLVCTENLIRIDLVTESHNVGGDDTAALLPSETADFTVQVAKSA